MTRVMTPTVFIGLLAMGLISLSCPMAAAKPALSNDMLTFMTLLSGHFRGDDFNLYVRLLDEDVSEGIIFEVKYVWSNSEIYRTLFVLTEQVDGLIQVETLGSKECDSIFSKSASSAFVGVAEPCFLPGAWIYMIPTRANCFELIIQRTTGYSIYSVVERYPLPESLTNQSSDFQDPCTIPTLDFSMFEPPVVIVQEPQKLEDFFPDAYAE